MNGMRPRTKNRISSKTSSKTDLARRSRMDYETATGGKSILLEIHMESATDIG